MLLAGIRHITLNIILIIKVGFFFLIFQVFNFNVFLRFFILKK
jgi:hypothetical protein